MENKPTTVVALGGNALLKRGEPLEADIQRKNIELAARTRSTHAAVARNSGTRQWPAGWTFGVTKQCLCQRHPYPLDILGAESQGMIGYMLQQALKTSSHSVKLVSC